MMLAMFAGENRDDWDDLFPAVMMAYRSSVHESTGFSPYRLMFGEDSPSLFKIPMLCGSGTRWRWHMTRFDVILVRMCCDRSAFMINGLSDACLLWGIGLCVTTHQLRSVNWTRPGLDLTLLCCWLDGPSEFSYSQLHQLS